MQEFTKEIIVESTPKKVFEVLADLQYANVLMPDVVAVDVLTEGDFGVGTVWRETRRFKMFGFFPVKAHANIEVSAYEKNKIFAAVSEERNMWAQYHYTTRSAGAGKTKVTMLGQFKCTGKLEGNEKKEKWLANWCEKTDGDLLDRVKMFVESRA